MRVRDVMTQHPVCCHAGDSAQSVAKALRNEDIGSLPVVADLDSRRLVGIITDRDLCCSRRTGVRSRYDDNRGIYETQPCKLSSGAEPGRLRETDADSPGSKAARGRREMRLVGMVSQADLARSEQPDKVHGTVARSPSRHEPSFSPR